MIDSYKHHPNHIITVIITTDELQRQWIEANDEVRI